MPLTAYAFDLYGTLVDIGSLRAKMARLVPNPAAFVDAWRLKQLQYALISTAMDRYVDFDAVTTRALEYVSAYDGLALTDEELHDLVAEWSRLPAFADVLPALDGLKARGCKLAVLSNAAPQTLGRAVMTAGLAHHIDGILSVDAIRLYKPRPEVYQLAVKYFDQPAEQIGFVTSNGWDATGASEAGLSAIWCNRHGLPDETLGAHPKRRIETLAELNDGT